MYEGILLLAITSICNLFLLMELSNTYYSVLIINIEVFLLSE